MSKYVFSEEQILKLEAVIEPIKAMFVGEFEIEEALTVFRVIRPVIKEFAPASTVEEYHSMLDAAWDFYDERCKIVRVVDDLLTWETLPLPLRKFAELSDGHIFSALVSRLLIPQSAKLLAKTVG